MLVVKGLLTKSLAIFQIAANKTSQLAFNLEIMQSQQEVARPLEEAEVPQVYNQVVTVEVVEPVLFLTPFLTKLITQSTSSSYGTSSE